MMEEASRIVNQQDTKTFNMVVTTRPWRTSSLLNADINYELMTFKQTMSLDERNDFIGKFFKRSKKDFSSGLVEYLGSERNIIPHELQVNKRMLLYICHIWEFAMIQNDNDTFFNKSNLLDKLWELMMWTHNKKYPEHKIGPEDLAEVRNKMGEIEDNKMSANEVNVKFGRTVNLFYMGIYTKSIRYLSNMMYNP